MKVILFKTIYLVFMSAPECLDYLKLSLLELDNLNRNSRVYLETMLP